MIEWVVGGVLVAGVIVLLPVLKVVAKVAPYAYPGARSRAMRSQLLDDDDMQPLLRRSYTDILYELQSYYPDLTQRLGEDMTFTQLDSVLRAELIETFLKVRRMSPEKTKRFIDALLEKYDLQVIESVVRTQAVSANRTSEILHPTETFSKNFILKETIRIEELLNELKDTPYFAVLSEYRDQVEKGEYEAFETALDLVYLKRLLSAAKTPESRGYAKFLIDSHNMSLVLKGREAIIPGGKIPLEALKDAKREDVIKAATDAGYKGVSGDHPAEVERTMRVALKRYGESLMARDPLSEAPIIGVLILKQIAHRNTSILLKMKSAGMKEERITEVLVQ